MKIFVAAAAVSALCTLLNAQSTTRVSVASDGTEGNADSGIYNIEYGISISADGRFVAFNSTASNLVPDDTNGVSDIFLHDRETGQTTLISIATGGAQGDEGSYSPSLSADGSIVAFSSHATNLVPNDTNGVSDIFIHNRNTGETNRMSVSTSGEQSDGGSYVTSISADGRFVSFDSQSTNLTPGVTVSSGVYVHDRVTGETTRVSVASNGEAANGFCLFPSISENGQFVAFNSLATNLVDDDSNEVHDVFIHDRFSGETSRISIATDGTEGNDQSYSPSLSADGRYVAFYSWASNLVPSIFNDWPDVFVHDRQTGETSLVSISSTGEHGNYWSAHPSISADGRFIAFNSFATNLVPGDMDYDNENFLYDQWTGETTRINITPDGIRPDSWSFDVTLSANGRFIAFESYASNIVPDDHNGHLDIYLHDRCAAFSCAGDADKDSTISFADITAALLRWNTNYLPCSGTGDANLDGIVDFADISSVLTNWNVDCSAGD